MKLMIKKFGDFLGKIVKLEISVTLLGLHIITITLGNNSRPKIDLPV